MLRYILTFGPIAGAIVIGVIIIGTSLADGGHTSQTFGYLTMLIALSSIFVAVKQFRDRNQGGVISFWKALQLGLGIAAVAGIVYTIGWETYLAVSGVDFIGEYANSLIEKKTASGASEAEIAKLTAQIEQVKENYKNPFFRLGITFSEIFPVGALVSLVSGGILRNPVKRGGI
ncbi:MAG: DUF4199 domain-containing protein [Pseudomonadota bacterium]